MFFSNKLGFTTEPGGGDILRQLVPDISYNYSSPLPTYTIENSYPTTTGPPIQHVEDGRVCVVVFGPRLNSLLRRRSRTTYFIFFPVEMRLQRWPAVAARHKDIQQLRALVASVNIRPGINCASCTRERDGFFGTRRDKDDLIVGTSLMVRVVTDKTSLGAWGSWYRMSGTSRRDTRRRPEFQLKPRLPT